MDRIVTEDGSIAPAEVDGEVRVTGPMVTKGYTDPALTAEAFDDDGYFRTGDRVTLHEDGWIQFADRVKDMIKVGGEGVSGAEIERTVLAVAGVKETAVVARPDPVYGEVAVAFVVLKDDAPTDTAQRIEAHCKASLAMILLYGKTCLR